MISVVKHKTAHKGPANTTCTRSIFREIGTYVKYLGYKIKTILSLYHRSGSAMDSSLITMQMSSFWKRALKIDTTGLSRIDRTLVRKCTTSTVHEHVSEIKQSTANLLCHNLRATESNYAIYDKQRKAANTSNLIKDVQRSTFEEGEKSNTEDSQKFHLKCRQK